MRVVLGLLLLLEAVVTALSVSGLLPTLAVYDWVVITALLLRGLVGAVQFAGGWLLIARRPPGEALAETGWIASAVLRAGELLFGLAPTNLVPSLRAPVVVIYAIYALACAGYVRATTRS